MNFHQPICASAQPGNLRRKLDLPQPSRPNHGVFVISLDFELHWGVRDHRPSSKDECSRLLAARAAVPQILDLFEEFSVNATWATVGMLFAHSREELEAFSPRRKPAYLDARLNPYTERIGKTERDDPYHFAPELIAEIASRRGQEIACHSFSHYYCMEPGQNAEDFEADLHSAVAIAANCGYTLTSYVFARNQVNRAYLPLLADAEITAYRANEKAAIKRAASFAEQQRIRYRTGRLLDAYANICGPQTAPWPNGKLPLGLHASRYLRPHNPKLAALETLLVNRIDNAMRNAARHCEVFHLWLHPEDVAPYVEENLQILRRVLELFHRYRSDYGMVSLSMAQLISAVTST